MERKREREIDRLESIQSVRYLKAATAQPPTFASHSPSALRSAFGKLTSCSAYGYPHPAKNPFTALAIFPPAVVRFFSLSDDPPPEAPADGLEEVEEACRPSPTAR